jgi:hypothetical protein
MKKKNYWKKERGKKFHRRFLATFLRVSSIRVLEEIFCRFFVDLFRVFQNFYGFLRVFVGFLKVFVIASSSESLQSFIGTWQSSFGMEIQQSFR